MMGSFPPLTAHSAESGETRTSSQGNKNCLAMSEFADP
jgi:hypothetical protein